MIMTLAVTTLALAGCGSSAGEKSESNVCTYPGF
jgi:hypothetical protein